MLISKDFLDESIASHRTNAWDLFIEVSMFKDRLAVNYKLLSWVDRTISMRAMHARRSLVRLTTHFNMGVDYLLYIKLRML